MISSKAATDSQKVRYHHAINPLRTTKGATSHLFIRSSHQSLGHSAILCILQSIFFILFPHFLLISSPWYFLFVINWYILVSRCLLGDSASRAVILALTASGRQGKYHRPSLNQYPIHEDSLTSCSLSFQWLGDFHMTFKPHTWLCNCGIQLTKFACLILMARDANVAFDVNCIL